MSYSMGEPRLWQVMLRNGMFMFMEVATKEGQQAST